MKCLTKLSVCLVFVTVTLHRVKADLLDECATNDVCTGTGGDLNAVCSNDPDLGGDENGNCICTGAYKNNGNDDGCVAKVITDNGCTPDDDDDGTTKCESVDPNAVCPESTNGNTNCACKADYFLSFDETQCVQSIEEITCTPGETGNNECNTQASNAECHADSSTCVCKAEYYLSFDKKTCVQKITMFDCTPDHGTEGNTKCQGIDTNSECPADGDKCACKPGYKGTDYCAKVLDETCSVAGDCTGWVDNSVCSSEKICVCEANYIKDGVACRKAAVTEITCEAGDKDCKFENSECDDAQTSPKCKCSDGYEKDSTDGSTCVKILGGACEGNLDCTGSVDNSVCSEKKCECGTNFIEESAVCKKAIGQTCTDQDTCVSNAECDEECKCLSGFTNSNGFCAAESSATSVWMASSLLVTALLSYLPRFILW